MRIKHDAMSRIEGVVLKVINDFLRLHCVPPTVLQIQIGAKLTSKSLVYYHLATLERLGKIEKRYGKPVPLWVIRSLAKSP